MTRELNWERKHFSWLNTFSTEDLIVIALLAALGLGTKQVIGPVLKAIIAAFLVPGGAIAGAFYMMWLVIARNAVDKPFSATLTGLVQGIAILILPYGNHGIMSLITYAAPGLSIDLLFYSLVLFRKTIHNDSIDLKGNEILNAFYGGIANVTGTFLTAEVFNLFSGLDPVIFVLVLLLAFASGLFGGLLAHVIFIEWQQIRGEKTDRKEMVSVETD